MARPRTRLVTKHQVPQRGANPTGRPPPVAGIGGTRLSKACRLLSVDGGARGDYLSAAEITPPPRSSIEANGPTTKFSLADSTPGCGRVGAMASAARTADVIRLSSS